jgi:cell division transport system permease protein
MQLKLRTIKFIIKEGIANTWKNKLMCLASMGTVVASLIILGMFILISQNIELMLSQIDSNQQVKAFLVSNITQEKIDEVKGKIEKIDLVKEIKFESKDEALKNLKKMKWFKGNESLLEGYENNNPLSPSFILVLKKAEYGAKITEELKGISEIKKVKYDQELTRKIVNIMIVVRWISFIVLILLGFTSIFIIANTIRITVFARRKEIGIMKFIGATDWFIKWPFIVESIIIGTLASFIALFIIGGSYGAIINWIIGMDTSTETSMISFVNFNSVSHRILIEYLIIGIGIGCLGSGISIRKHLRV